MAVGSSYVSNFNNMNVPYPGTDENYPFSDLELDYDEANRQILWRSIIWSVEHPAFSLLCFSLPRITHLCCS